ncbi:Uncharacterised protein [Bordetella pertussis]|nr:Uncharacterised protein [Bordetella pertussis]
MNLYRSVSCPGPGRSLELVPYEGVVHYILWSLNTLDPPATHPGPFVHA